MTRSSSFAPAAFGFAAVFVPILPAAAQALVFQAPLVQSAAGGTGSFDLLLVNSNLPGGASYGVAGDSVEISIVPGSGVTFTDVTIDTVTPYLFQTTFTDAADPLAITTLPNTDFIAADGEAGPNQQDFIVPGQAYGVAHVVFQVAGGASPGVFTLTFGRTGPPPSGYVQDATSLSDNNGNAIPFREQGGTFIIAAAPEPSPLAALLVGVLGLGGSLRLHRKRSV